MIMPEIITYCDGADDESVQQQKEGKVKTMIFLSAKPAAAGALSAWAESAAFIA